jgi:putative CocE/NonD family hydrolase
MIIGPWSHIALDKLFIMPLKISHMRAIFDFFQNLLPFPWYEYWLKEYESGLNNDAPIKAFILNRNGWRYFYDWPPETDIMKLYLHSNGNANSRFGDGTLSKSKPQEEHPDKFIFDPSNPVTSKGGRNLFLLSGPHNQKTTENRKDVLVYTTKPLKEGLEIIGEVKLVLFASSSVKDTDFMVKLLDVSMNGLKAVNVIDSGIRTRFRKGDLNNPSFIEPKKIYEFIIPIGSTAIYFSKNHQIRIEITSSNFPRFDVNSNLAGEQSKNLFQSAEQVVFHDENYPSHLVLPIYNKY